MLKKFHDKQFSEYNEGIRLEVKQYGLYVYLGKDTEHPFKKVTKVEVEVDEETGDIHLTENIDSRVNFTYVSKNSRTVNKKGLVDWLLANGAEHGEKFLGEYTPAEDGIARMIFRKSKAATAEA